MSNATTEAKIIEDMMLELRELGPVCTALDGLHEEEDAGLRAKMADAIHAHVEPYRTSERALRDVVKRLAEADSRTPVRAEVVFGEKAAVITVSLPTLTPDRGAFREDDVKERLGERIRRMRAEHKLGLRETATKVGISPTYLSRIETMNEKTPPAEDVIRKLAKLLNDDFDELMHLAGRVPEDVEKVIKGDPSMPAFLRTAKEQKLSGEELGKILEAHNKGKR